MQSVSEASGLSIFMGEEVCNCDTDCMVLSRPKGEGILSAAAVLEE